MIDGYGAPDVPGLMDLVQGGIGFSVRRLSRKGRTRRPGQELVWAARSSPVKVVKRREDGTVDEYLIPNEAEARLDRERAAACDYCGSSAAGVWGTEVMCARCFDHSWQAAVAGAISLIQAGAAIAWTAAGAVEATKIQRRLDALGAAAVAAAVDYLGPIRTGDAALVERCARKMQDEHPRLARRLAGVLTTNLYRGQRGEGGVK